MKSAILVLLFSLSYHVSAITITSPISIIDNGSGAACESESVFVQFGVGNFTDDGDGNDYYAHALVDARGVVMNFIESSIASNSSTFAFGIFQSMSGITARPLTFVFFDKLTTDATPGGSDTAKYEYAVSNYQIVKEKIFDPVDEGLETCDVISELYCHDPLVYKSSVEALVCGVGDDPLAGFTSPLAAASICIPSGTISGGLEDIDYCQGACGGGTGCEVVVDTDDLANFTENQMCASYQYSVPVFDMSSSFSGSCSLNLTGDYYIGSFWEGGYHAPFSWFYTNPSMVMKWFTQNVTENPGCTLNYSPYTAFIEGLVYDSIENYYSNHFTSNANNDFCEIE